MQTEVSIIIPCYNHGRYLPDAVQSILAQTFCDWEAIIVDDGSTDETRAVSARFTDPRIRYIHQQNQGLSAARNTGIRAATGRYISLLDADDLWDSRFLSESVHVLKANAEAAATYCGFQYIAVDGSLLPVSVCRAVPADSFRGELLKGNWLSACSVMVRSEIYREIGLFDESLHACEDYDMWLRISEQHQFIGIAKLLVRYRRAGDNMSDDVDRMSNAVKTVLERQLGSLDTPMERWSEQKRSAAANLDMLRAVGYLSQGRTTASAESMSHLVGVRPDFARSLDAWYSLACAHQLVGHRGDLATWRPCQAEKDLVSLLAELRTLGVDNALLRAMASQAYNALARLHYSAGNNQPARFMLFRSFRLQLRLPHSVNRSALAIRLLLGSRLLRRSRRLRQLGQGQLR